MATEEKTSNYDEAALLFVERRETLNRFVELWIWLAAALLVGSRVLFDILSRAAPPALVFEEHYFECLLAVLTLIFPFFFQLIFGSLPLESIRRKRASSQLETRRPPESDVALPRIREAEIRVLSDAMSRDELATAGALVLFAYYASSSRRLSQSMYSRAGVYLLVGVAVAFSGLAFFYSQTVRLSGADLQGVPLIVALAPKFGILFFIEFVALFFLRQYRSAMDEFRYFEAIKRSREETLALIRILSDGGKEVDPINLVKNESFFSRAGVLDKGQSTEILESRKLEKNELELLEKVIDVVSRSKK